MAAAKNTIKVAAGVAGAGIAIAAAGNPATIIAVAAGAVLLGVGYGTYRFITRDRASDGKPSDAEDQGATVVRTRDEDGVRRIGGRREK